MKLYNNITDKDLVYIKNILENNDLSLYKLDRNDFVCYKENNKIIAFGRIYNIDDINYELSSLWVENGFRGKKLGLKITKQLLKIKNYSNNLYLATKENLEDYYKVVGFVIIDIDSKLPKRFLETLKWAKKENINAIIMKYNK